MIGKVTHGRGFGGLLSYLLHGTDGHQQDRVAWAEVRNLVLEDLELAPSVMHAAASQSVRVEKPVYHLTISLDPQETLSPDEMRKVVDRTLSDLGLEDHQAVLVAHDDRKHQHVHVMINRVHPETGLAWHTGHDYARIEKSLRGQERELGLREVKGRHFALEGQERHQGVEPSSGDRRQRERTGERPFGEHVRAVARRDLLEAPTWESLHQRLDELGLRLEKRGRGLVVTNGEQRAKASFVDRKTSLAGLERRLGTWQPSGRDFPAGKPRRLEPGREAPSDLSTASPSAMKRTRSDQADRWQTQSAERQGQRLANRHRAAERSPSISAWLRSTATHGLRAGPSKPHSVPVAGKLPFKTLARKPEEFGRLRGRGGLFASAERWEAIETAPQAAVAARDWSAARPPSSSTERVAL